MPGSAARAADGERGAFIVLWSLLLVGLVTMMAIVVDLGHLREARATTQSVADMAALAAGEHLASLSSPDPQEACWDAVSFIRMNVPDMPAGMAVPCGDLPETCLETTPKAVVGDGGTAGRYQVEITFPVPDADIYDDRAAMGLRVDDGHPCERMRVSIRRTNDGFFTGVLGVNQLSTNGSAVVRRRPPEVSRIPNLWLLDPTGCTALSAQGGSQLIVGTLTKAGLITLDSDGSSCGNNAYTIKAGGSSWIEVVPAADKDDAEKNPNELDPPGEISLVAMWPGQTNCSDGNPKACDPGDIGWTNNIVPQPTRREQRATRAIVDHRYNCRSGGQGQWHSPSSQYPPYPADINVPKIPIANCNDADGKPFVDHLRMAAGPSGRPGGELSSFKQWTRMEDGETPRFACDNPVVPAELPGNWWIDCPDGLVVDDGSLNFTGGNIVFDGALRMSGGTVQINSGLTEDPTVLERDLSDFCHTNVTGCLEQSSPEAAVVYFRRGNIRFSSNPKLVVTNTAVIQDRGFVRLNGQAPPVWSSPRKGPFAGLSLWSETADGKGNPEGNYLINGGSQMELEGVFFTPQAQFSISGGGGQDALSAQFISYRLDLSGGGILKLEPDGLNQLSLPPPVAALIR